jgi:hypothetical protein
LKITLVERVNPVIQVQWRCVKESKILKKEPSQRVATLLERTHDLLSLPRAITTVLEHSNVFRCCPQSVTDTSFHDEGSMDGSDTRYSSVDENRLLMGIEKAKQTRGINHFCFITRARLLLGSCPTYYMYRLPTLLLPFTDRRPISISIASLRSELSSHVAAAMLRRCAPCLYLSLIFPTRHNG